MSSERKKDTISSWIYLGVLAFAVCLIMGLMNSVGLLVVVFVDYFKESNAKAGWIGSILWFLDCSSFPVVVFLRRHFGFRIIVISTSLLIAFAFIVTPFMPTLDFIFLTYSIAFGIGSGFFDCLSIITLREYFDKYLGVATGFRFASIGVGIMIYNYILPILFDTIGWRKTFFALSALLGMACFACSMVYHSPVNQRKESLDLINKNKAVEIRTSKKTGTSHRFLRNRTYLFLLIGNVPFVFVVLIPATFLMQYAKDLGYPLSKSKWLLIIYGLASLLGRLTVARIGDFALKKKKVTHITILALVLFGVGNGLCSFTRSLPLMISCAGIIGFSEGMYWVNLPLMNIEVTAGKQADEAYSLMMFVTAFGQLLGPPASGWLFDVYGDFRYVLYVVCTCAITGALIMVIGTCLTSQKYFPTSVNTHDDEKVTSVSYKTYELDYITLLGKRTVLPETKSITLVQYESAI